VAVCRCLRDSIQRGALHSGAPGTALAACEAGPGAGATPKRVVLSHSRGCCFPAPLQSSSGAAPRQGRWPGLGRRVSAGDESVLRRPGVRFMGYPSAALTSRSAPALYPQQGSCPSYTFTIRERPFEAPAGHSLGRAASRAPVPFENRERAFSPVQQPPSPILPRRRPLLQPATTGSPPPIPLG
jgi:hypothetical protein